MKDRSGAGIIGKAVAEYLEWAWAAPENDGGAR